MGMTRTASYHAPCNTSSIRWVRACQWQAALEVAKLTGVVQSQVSGSQVTQMPAEGSLPTLQQGSKASRWPNTRSCLAAMLLLAAGGPDLPWLATAPAVSCIDIPTYQLSMNPS